MPDETSDDGWASQNDPSVPSCHQPPPPSAYPPPAGYESTPSHQYEPPPDYYQTQPPTHPPPPTQSAIGMPSPPASRSGIGTTARVLIAFVVVLMLGVGACSFWFVQTIKAPVDEANEFLALIDAGQYDAAVARSNPACNDGMTPGDIALAFDRRDLDYDLTSSHIADGAAAVSGSLDLDGEPQVGIEVFLQKRNEEWLVCGFGINPTNTID